MFEEGKEKASRVNLAICAIVRDCEKNLRNNIVVMDKIRSYFKSSVVVIFENDSKDKTKEVLAGWSSRDKDVFIETSQNHGITIPKRDAGGVNKYFSEFRLSKLASYRNNYLEKLESLDFEPDYVLMADLDLERIYFEGVIKSFAIANEWDVVCANVTSLSPQLKKRYHDTYALVELGKENVPQTEESIRENSKKWSFLKEGQPLIPVYSAFGGVAIYRYEAIKGLRYRIALNHDKRVEAWNEHFTFCQDIRAKGFQRIYINPGLRAKSQSVNFALIKKYLKDRFRP